MSQEKENKPQEHGKHVLYLTINEKKYDWHKQNITGTEIKQLANIPLVDELFLSIKKPLEDEQILNETEVDLARPGLEHFYSKIKYPITIIVSGEQKSWSKPQISFQEVIVLAYGSYIDKPTMVYTVAFEDGPKENPEGSMLKGAIVYVKHKMIFHATATDKS